MESADEVRGVRDVLPADPGPLRRRVANPVDKVLERVAEFAACQDVVDLIFFVAIVCHNGAGDRKDP